MIRRAIPRTSALGMLAATRFTATRAMATTNYRSTRGGQQVLTFEQAVMQGLATDRGLLVPENLPQFPAGGVEAFRGLSYEALALEIMSLYIGPEDIPKAELKDIIDRSYGTFRDRDVTPVVPLGVDASASANRSRGRRRRPIAPGSLSGPCQACAGGNWN